MSLSHRENLLNIWHRKGIEFAPVHIILCPSLVEQFKAKYGDDFVVEEWADFSFRYIDGPTSEHAPPEFFLQFYKDVEFGPDYTIGQLGIVREKQPGSMHMHRMYHPMRNFDSLEQFQAYPYPIFRWEDNVETLSNARLKVADLHKRGYASIGSAACSIWESGWQMRDMMQLMMDMATEDEKAVYHLDRMTEMGCFKSEFVAKAGADIVHMGDDIGMQDTIMMSPEMYREWLKPRQAKMIRAAKAAKPDILVAYHSCGFIEPFIPDLIEIGVDILNPVQPECMDFAKLHAEYKDVLSFWGTIGTQTTMPFGSVQDVRDCVKRNLDIAGPEGGLLCCPTHLLEPEVPLANIEAYIDACREYQP